MKGCPAPRPDTSPFLRYSPDTRPARRRRPDVSSPPGCPGGDVPRGRVPTTPAGDSSRVRGQPSCPRTRGLHPSMSNVPSRESLLPTPRPSRGPLGQSIRGGSEGDRVHIGYKGSERTHTDERKPHDSAVHMDGRGALAVLCHRFGHSGPRSSPVRCQCALPSSTRSTPAMMSAMPAAMVRVSGSPKRNREAIAVTATPPADQIP